MAKRSGSIAKGGRTSKGETVYKGRTVDTTRAAPSGGFENLNPVFASRLQAMFNAAAAEGVTLGIGSGYRTVQEQIELRRRNGCPDIWSSPASSCRVPTAIPGRSNHNRGLAADLTGDKDWANRNAHRFGLAFTVAGEDWHVELADDQAARAAGAGGQGLNTSWPTETGNPEDELSSRLDTILGILTGDPVDPMMSAPDSEGVGQQSAPGMAGPVSGAGNEFGDYALAQFARYGWSENELDALIRLWNRESGDPDAATITWNPAADNPNSSAQGIAQKLQSVHGPVEPTWQGQIDWGLNYIFGRYGSPSAALAAHDQQGWY